MKVGPRVSLAFGPAPCFFGGDFDHFPGAAGFQLSFGKDFSLFGTDGFREVRFPFQHQFGGALQDLAPFERGEGTHLSGPFDQCADGAVDFSALSPDNDFYLLRTKVHVGYNSPCTWFSVCRAISKPKRIL